MQYFYEKYILIVLTNYFLSEVKLKNNFSILNGSWWFIAETQEICAADIMECNGLMKNYGTRQLTSE